MNHTNAVIVLVTVAGGGLAVVALIWQAIEDIRETRRNRDLPD
jgi:hypothetical protein